MGFARYVAKEFVKEIGNKSREFYEFVLPPIDMFEDGNELVIVIDLSGFSKKDIKLRIMEDVLSINAKREPEEVLGTTYLRQRPNHIDKKIPLPFSVTDDEKVVGTAAYVEGVITLKIPIPKSNNIPIT
jgi:HSP20 family molecular chaperone IbpA